MGLFFMDKVRARDPLNQPLEFDRLKKLTTSIPFPAHLEWQRLSGFALKLFFLWWNEWWSHLANKSATYYCKKIFLEYDSNNQKTFILNHLQSLLLLPLIFFASLCSPGDN